MPTKKMRVEKFIGEFEPELPEFRISKNEIESILTEEIETLVRVHSGLENLPFWITPNQAIIQVCERIIALVKNNQPSGEN